MRAKYSRRRPSFVPAWIEDWRAMDAALRIPDKMSRHMSFVGQRADKAVVVDIAGIETYEGADGVERVGVAKVVDHYTVSCDECDGDGYYDQRGEIICEGCGMVLSGERDPVIKTEWSEGSENSIGKGRGVETDSEVFGPNQGTHEPSI